ncbi:MAG: NUDIX domain-containing protein [Patescibacteria group bacterium]
MRDKVFIAIIKRGTEFLFQRREKDPYKGYLGLLGGKSEKGESAEEALIREIREESMLSVTESKFLGIVTETLYRKHVTTQVELFIYTVKTRGTATSHPHEGEVVWIKREELKDRKDEFIPTDWLIHTRVLSDQFKNFKLTVFEKENQFTVIAD